ncbi:hypothetical protein [Flammeovirga sp. SJP92]|uniref:hypothetical protein n=1 Tax=Flammeovirga sp. SJP92 TaxID=1775430 RepID=UPI000787D073|nr:hypothetical protein [Flammeovirga sp. SJP92]KXX66942.1 hypothetical protein AVL50_29760 [Flammeovirga sp. SJP92]
MGFKVLLIATKFSQKENDFSALSVKSTNTFSEYEDHGVATAMTKNGYRIYYIMDNIEPNPKIFKKMSQDCELQTLFIYENLLCSFTSNWVNGQENWSVLHNCEEGGIEHIKTDGEVPKFFEEIKIEKHKLQEDEIDVDYYFEIAPDIFKKITGYRHDIELLTEEKKPWEILER